MSLDQARSKLDEIKSQYDQLVKQMNDPDFCMDHVRYTQAAKARGEIESVAVAYTTFCQVMDDIPVAEEMGMQEEIDQLKVQKAKLEEDIRLMLLPKDPNDKKNVFVEVRAAAGGDEANLFASELYRMFTRYAERRLWKTELQDIHETGMGGVQDVTFKIEGQGAYSQLKFEGGVHRVQRVPATETKGRIHTSTVTVAVLPEADEVDIQLDEKEIKEDIYHSSSAGGQNVQKVATAIRLTHIPTGLVVTCQDERSQLQNKLKARAVLRARLYERHILEQAASRSGDRRSQVGTGERSEKIRTYNFPDGRMIDILFDLFFV